MTDEPDLARLFEQHYSGLVRLASLLLKEVPVAEEVVQDAFVKLHSHWWQLRDPSRAAFYLRRAVINGCHSKLRRARVADRHNRARGEVRDVPSAESAAVVQLTRIAVAAAITDLPLRQREVVYFRYYLGLTEAEIAKVLGISRGAVKSHASRAYATQRKILEAYQ